MGDHNESMNTPDGAELESALTDYDYDGSLKLAEAYDSDFLDYYATEHADQAAQLTTLLQREKDGAEPSVALADALGELDAILSTEYPEAIAAQKEAEKAAKGKETSDLTRQYLEPYLQNDIKREWGGLTKATCKLNPDKTAEITISNSAVGEAGKMTLSTVGPYQIAATKWKLEGSECVYEGAYGFTALDYMEDDIYALETQLTGIKEGKYKVPNEGDAFDGEMGWLRNKESMLSSNDLIAFGEIEASNPAAFVKFANARYTEMIGGAQPAKEPQMSIADLRREDDEVLSTLGSIDREMVRIFDPTMKNLNTWEGLHPEPVEGAEPGQDFRSQLDTAYAHYHSSSTAVDVPGAQEGLGDFKAVAAELEAALPIEQRVAVVTEPSAPEAAPGETEFVAKLREKPDDFLTQKTEGGKTTVDLTSDIPVRESRIHHIVGPVDSGALIPIKAENLEKTVVTGNDGVDYSWDGTSWMNAGHRFLVGPGYNMHFVISEKRAPDQGPSVVSTTAVASRNGDTRTDVPPDPIDTTKAPPAAPDASPKAPAPVEAVVEQKSAKDIVSEKSTLATYKVLTDMADMAFPLRGAEDLGPKIKTAFETRFGLNPMIRLGALNVDGGHLHLRFGQKAPDGAMKYYSWALTSDFVETNPEAQNSFQNYKTFSATLPALNEGATAVVDKNYAYKIKNDGLNREVMREFFTTLFKTKEKGTLENPPTGNALV